MIDRLSILLPTYNCNCVSMVKTLHKQCEDIDSLNYEIIVADDCSTQKQFIEENKKIEQLTHVIYICREHNVGRSAIRNFLVKQAQYDWLLLIDGDLELDNKKFIYNYLISKGDIVVGGITIGGTKKEWGSNLRWKYEKACEKAHSLENRKKNALELHTNFLISRKNMLNHPFDERLSQYGYEDVLLGKTLVSEGLEVEHIDNPVLFAHYESNEQFINKTQEALKTLYVFKNELHGYSRLLSIMNKIKRYSGITPLNITYQLFHTLLITNLKGNKPSIYAFKIYKILHFAHLIVQNG